MVWALHFSWADRQRSVYITRRAGKILNSLVNISQLKPFHPVQTIASGKPPSATDEGSSSQSATFDLNFDEMLVDDRPTPDTNGTTSARTLNVHTQQCDNPCINSVTHDDKGSGTALGDMPVDDTLETHGTSFRAG